MTMGFGRPHRFCFCLYRRHCRCRHERRRSRRHFKFLNFNASSPFKQSYDQDYGGQRALKWDPGGKLSGWGNPARATPLTSESERQSGRLSPTVQRPAVTPRRHGWALPRTPLVHRWSPIIPSRDLGTGESNPEGAWINFKSITK